MNIFPIPRTIKTSKLGRNNNRLTIVYWKSLRGGSHKSLPSFSSTKHIPNSLPSSKRLHNELENYQFPMAKSTISMVPSTIFNTANGRKLPGRVSSIPSAALLRPASRGAGLK